MVSYNASSNQTLQDTEMFKIMLADYKWNTPPQWLHLGFNTPVASWTFKGQTHYEYSTEDTLYGHKVPASEPVPF